MQSDRARYGAWRARLIEFIAQRMDSAASAIAGVVVLMRLLGMRHVAVSRSDGGRSRGGFVLTSIKRNNQIYRS